MQEMNPSALDRFPSKPKLAQPLGLNEIIARIDIRESGEETCPALFVVVCYNGRKVRTEFYWNAREL